MSLREWGFRRRLKALAGLILGGIFMLGFLGECDDRLVKMTRYVDPCGTLLNCTPGTFEVNAAEIGDYCIDPTCTVPGQCGEGQALGTMTDLCP
ncbi:MAG: hypothetical protein WBE26_15155 [Phycisphaerae bacterium]